MRYTKILTFLFLFTLLLSQVSNVEAQSKNMSIVGSWQMGPEENRTVWIATEKHFAATIYNLKDKKFIGTFGGTWKADGNQLVQVQEFNTLNSDLIGKETKRRMELKDSKLTVKGSDKGKDEMWTRVDDGTPGKLSGAWVITGRVVDGESSKITPGARKTMKILSGTRFQWIAYNSETKEFFGTGGGTYTSENGKYVELIDFFSRDNTRVGMSLEFDFSFEEGNWHHKGLSSKGDPIDEIWTKRDVLGI